MEPLQIYERLKERFGERVLETVEKKPDPFVVVDPAVLVETAVTCATTLSLRWIASTRRPQKP
jgi:hypothetical protein